MRFSIVASWLLAASQGLAAAVAQAQEATNLDRRQSGRTTTWVDNCKPGSPGPSDYRAFNLGGCNFQLTLTRDRGMVGVNFEFEAAFADGSRQKFTPYRNYDNFAVSDYFYAVDLGNNWRNSSAQGRQFTSVHELSSVCKSGAAPVAWYVLASSDGCGRPKGYTFTSPRIGVENGSRPGATRPSARRINSAGDYEISWAAVSNAAAYTVLFKVPTGSDELGNPYTRVIGSRVQAPNTRAVHQGVISQRWEGRARQVAVNVVNAQGVWNYTPDSPIVSAPW